MAEVNLIQESWSIKKIIIAIAIATVFLGGTAYFVKTYVLNKQISPKKTISQNSFKSVQGASTEDKNDSSKTVKQSISLPSADALKSDAQSKLDSIKAEVSNLNIEEAASSSPQVQKVIDDLKSLENYPKNQAKEMCQKVCDGLK